MNFISKHQTGSYAGMYVLHRSSGPVIYSLGSKITVFVRRVVPQTDTRELNYVVEIKQSLHHVTGYSKAENNIAILCVPAEGADCQIATSILKDDGIGSEHRMGLLKYRVGEEDGYVMTIGGLLWDGRLVHVSNIIA